MQLLPRSLKWSPLLLAALVAACGVGRRFTSEVDDYSSYRRTRVAASEEDRLQAAFAYLEREPNGNWRREVAAWFYRAEAAYYAKAHDSMGRLRRYLSVLPKGPHARAAANRIAEFELAAAYANRADEQTLSDARRIQTTLQAALRSRREIVKNVADWTKRIAGIRSWGGRTHELHHEFINEYRLVEPAARCDLERCVKALSLRYQIPEAGTLSEREAVYDVVLTLRDGGVVRAELTGPELFSRLGEAIERTAVRPDAALARAEALAQVAELIMLVIEPLMPAQRCSREAVSPVILERVCDGLRLRVIAATDATQEDRIVVEPVSP